MKMMKCIPYLPVYDISKAVDFYKSRFGFSVMFHDNGFAKLIRHEAEIHLWVANDERWKIRDTFTIEPIASGAESFLPGTGGCRVQVQFIDALYEEYKTSGVLYSEKTVIEQQPWGTREFPSLDLDRNLLTFFERISK